MTYTLYGAPPSMYTGKARSYLRRQGIDFVEIPPGSDRYLEHVVPAVGRWIIPVLETPDGELVQDGADIIDHVEKGPGQAVRTLLRRGRRSWRSVGEHARTRSTSASPRTACR